MQNTKKTLSKLFIASIFFAVIFTAFRILLISLNFDFESGFFANKTIATCYYVLVIAVSVFFYFIKKKSTKDTFGISNSVFSIVLSLLFIALTLTAPAKDPLATPLEAAMSFIALVSGVMSAFHYIIYAFNKNKSLIALTNIFPVIFFISKSTIIFMNQSVQANTYYSFSNSISLIALAFALLYEGKALIDSSEKRLLSLRLVTFFAVTQSVVPDLYFFIKDKLTLSFSEIITTVIQFTYVLYFIFKTFKTITSDSEDKI